LRGASEHCLTFSRPHALEERLEAAYKRSAAFFKGPPASSAAVQGQAFGTVGAAASLRMHDKVLDLKEPVKPETPVGDFLGIECSREVLDWLAAHFVKLVRYC
jgi:hypothetical protein